MRIVWGGVALLCAVASASAADAPVLMPSGQQASLLDIVADEVADSLRLRYLVPAIADATQPYARMFELVFEDMQWLCETQLAQHFPLAQQEGWSRAVITMLSEPLELGARDVGVVQFFESFSLAGDGCQWDEYDD